MSDDLTVRLEDAANTVRRLHCDTAYNLYDRALTEIERLTTQRDAGSAEIARLLDALARCYDAALFCQDFGAGVCKIVISTLGWQPSDARCDKQEDSNG